jgi:hypothetical protein
MYATALTNPRKGLLGYQNSPRAKAAIRHKQIELATAQRFFVSNKLLEHAVVASYVKPKHLFAALERALPPFNNMWIEWDEEYRKTIEYKWREKLGVDWLEAYDNDRLEARLLLEEKGMTPFDKAGFHIQKKNDRCFFCFAFNTPEQKIMLPLYNMSIFYEGDITAEFLAEAVKVSPEQVEERYITEQGGVFLGDEYLHHHGMDSTYADTLMRRFMSFMDYNATVMTFPEKPEDEKLNSLKIMSLHQMHGMGRFMVSLLGLLNYDLIIQETGRPEKIKGARFADRDLKVNEYTTIDIELPKPRGKRIYERMFTGQGSPKREHWRRGHWRTLRDEAGNLKKRVWIDAMKCGDPKLGSIIHDYNLRTK